MRRQIEAFSQLMSSVIWEPTDRNRFSGDGPDLLVMPSKNTLTSIDVPETVIFRESLCGEFSTAVASFLLSHSEFWRNHSAKASVT